MTLSVRIHRHSAGYIGLHFNRQCRFGNIVPPLRLHDVDRGPTFYFRVTEWERISSRGVLIAVWSSLPVTPAFPNAHVRLPDFEIPFEYLGGSNFAVPYGVDGNGVYRTDLGYRCVASSGEL